MSVKSFINFRRNWLILVSFLVILFSLPVEANPYLSSLLLTPQSSKGRAYNVSTNQYCVRFVNNVGAITNLTACGWMTTENAWFDIAAFFHQLSLYENRSRGEDVLAGACGWDDGWISGNTNMPLSLDTGVAYCLVGYSSAEATISLGDGSVTVDGAFDEMLINDNSLTVTTTGNWRMGMVQAETNEFIYGVHLDKLASSTETVQNSQWKVGRTNAWFCWEYAGSNFTTTVKMAVGENSSTNFVTQLDNPIEFEKGSIFDFGQISLGFSNPHTNTFFDFRCYGRLLSEDEKAAIYYDGKKELQHRGYLPE